MKIGVVGRVLESLCDGQTVKTRVLVGELKKRYPDCEIYMAETGDVRKHPVRLIRQIIRCLKEADVVFVLLSRNGIRVVLPILFSLNRFFHKPILHDCIGGAQDETIRMYPRLRKYYAKMQVNWVETEQLKKRLEAEGLTNVQVLPNFKVIQPMDPEHLRGNDTYPYRFCTFSRVIKEKGITAAAEAVREINREKGFPACAMDIYGPVESRYQEEFDEILAASGDVIRYMGVVDYNESVRILQDYYMLLFPTYFRGEGFPGTLIDAFSAGLPVIATDWHCNGEIIAHEKTGFLYDVEQPEKLKQWMLYSMEHPQQIHQMRFQCLQDVKQYSAETVMQTIHEKLTELVP